MTCNEVRQYWNLYHDSEGEAALHFQIGEHLGICPECAEWFDQQRRLESLLVEKLATHTPTPELWQRIHQNVGLTPPVPTRPWSWLVGVSLCAAVLVLVLLGRRLLVSHPDLPRLTAQWHQQLESGQQQVEYENASDTDVENYLRQRVPFQVRCPPRKNSGFTVKGAGVCEFAHQPAAYVWGEVDRMPVSIFILSSDSLATFPEQEKAIERDYRHRCREGPYQMVLAVMHKNVVVVVGQLEAARLEQVLNYYATYPEQS